MENVLFAHLHTSHQHQNSDVIHSWEFQRICVMTDRFTLNQEANASTVSLTPEPRREERSVLLIDALKVLLNSMELVNNAQKVKVQTTGEEDALRNDRFMYQK